MGVHPLYPQCPAAILLGVLTIKASLRQVGLQLMYPLGSVWVSDENNFFTTLTHEIHCKSFEKLKYLS